MAKEKLQGKILALETDERCEIGLALPEALPEKKGSNRGTLETRKLGFSGGVRCKD